MDFNAAKELLDRATRWELRDHSFGDVEFGFIIDGVEIATGYSGGDKCDLSIIPILNITGLLEYAHFNGDEARKLKECGTSSTINRNDETGPDVFQEGFVMKGLTLQGVYEELTEVMEF